MYVYKRTSVGEQLWTAGYYGRKWEPESDHKTSEAAAARVHYLNGGEREKGRKVCWTTGDSESPTEHVGWLLKFVVVSDGTGLNRPCMIVERADGSVGLTWVAFNKIKFVD